MVKWGTMSGLPAPAGGPFGGNYRVRALAGLRVHKMPGALMPRGTVAAALCYPGVGDKPPRLGGFGAVNAPSTGYWLKKNEFPQVIGYLTAITALFWLAYLIGTHVGHLHVA